MKINVIKRLTEEVELKDLQEAESMLEDGLPLKIQVEGDDEGEQLTHIMAAIWVKKDMDKNGTDVRTSLRNYTQKVRNSIS